MVNHYNGTKDYQPGSYMFQTQILCHQTTVSHVMIHCTLIVKIVSF